METPDTAHPGNAPAPAQLLTLAPEPLRVLGALMEKEMITPENYPLSLNALLQASNQKTSREPVMDLSEDQVRSALDLLLAHDLISTARDARVPKYEHRIRTVLTLRRDETALLCLLLLRGPQTAGELRGRSDRMHTFDDIASVQSALDRLAARETPLVAILPRQPGSSAPRAMHLLGDPAHAPQPGSQSGSQPRPAPAAGSRPDELETLKQTIAALEQRVAALEARLEAGQEASQEAGQEATRPAHEES